MAEARENYLETKYVPFLFGIRFIFRKDGNRWKYHGWYKYK